MIHARIGSSALLAWRIISRTRFLHLFSSFQSPRTRAISNYRPVIRRYLYTSLMTNYCGNSYIEWRKMKQTFFNIFPGKNTRSDAKPKIIWINGLFHINRGNQLFVFFVKISQKNYLKQRIIIYFVNSSLYYFYGKIAWVRFLESWLNCQWRLTTLLACFGIPANPAIQGKPAFPTDIYYSLMFL